MSALLVGVVPPGVVTEIGAVPAACAGAVAVIEMDEFTVKTAVVVPNLTWLAVENPVPAIVTLVPPDVGPLVRDKEVMVGTGS